MMFDKPNNNCVLTKLLCDSNFIYVLSEYIIIKHSKYQLTNYLFYSRQKILPLMVLS